MRLIFKTSSVTPDFFYVFSIILSFSTCSQSFKKIRTWEILGANVLKVFHHWFRRRESNFDAWDTLSFNSAWNNLPKSKLEEIKLCNFKMDLMKWQLNWVECNFGLKSYLRFQVSSSSLLRLPRFQIWTHTVGSFDFEITLMVSDQIALHSVYWIMYQSNRSLNIPPRVTPQAFEFLEIFSSNSPLAWPKRCANARL